MRNSVLMLAAGLVATAPLAPAQSQPATQTAKFEAVDRAFADFRAKKPVPGMVYGVVIDGKLAHLGVNGVRATDGQAPVDEATRFRIASMSKAFTALAILSLRDQGNLGLDDLAEKHIPEMRTWHYPTSDSPRIRVRDLLHHVGG
ncbi:MAG TPA: serine hydrolase domain-containing protein, partial [Sphingomicrobium sp.]